MQIDWLGIVIQLVLLSIAMATLMWRISGSQEKRLLLHLDTKFKSETEQRRVNESHINTLLEEQKLGNRENERDLQKVRREMLELKALLPEKYVRREDYIRGQTVIESKLDALALRLENQRSKGVSHD